MVVAFWVHDAETMKKKLTILGTILAVDLVLVAIFLPIGWV